MMIRSLRNISRTPKVADRKRRLLVMALHSLLRLPLLPWSTRRLGSSGPPESILLIRVDGIGDLIMTSPLFPSLRRQYPQARIDLVCSDAAKSLAELFEASGDLSRVYSLPFGKVGGKRWRALARELRDNRYDVAVDLRGDFRSVLLARMSAAPRRIGFPYSGFDYLLTDVLPMQRMHQADEVSQLAARLGIEGLSPVPRLPLGDEQRAFASRWLSERRVTAGRPLVGFHLSAFQSAKLWPVDRFVQAARRLRDQFAAQILVVGAPGDRPQAQVFSEALDEPAYIAAGETSLPQTAGLLERCSLFIGNDSGPAHLAAAVGTPAIVLFGPTDPFLWRPYTARVLQSARPCDPRCNSKTCAVPQRHCLADIPVDQVIDAAEQILHERARQ